MQHMIKGFDVKPSTTWAVGAHCLDPPLGIKRAIDKYHSYWYVMYAYINICMYNYVYVYHICMYVCIYRIMYIYIGSCVYIYTYHLQTGDLP